MIVVIKSAPDTPEGKRAVKLARDMSADIVLLQNGVYFIRGRQLEDLGFCEKIYVLEDDVKLRGLQDVDTNMSIKDISYDGLADLMTESEKVLGMF